MSDGFDVHLVGYRKRWREARERGASHDQLRFLFTSFLRDAYPSLDIAEIDLERELKGVGVRGRIDLLYRNVVFEFKRDFVAEHATGLEELSRYMRGGSSL